jgi:alkaline phosphatase
MKRWIICLFWILILSPCLSASWSRGPRNIILMVGDGMGVARVTAGRCYKGSLALEEFEHVGLVLTQAHGDDFITDSAASATAMATGIQTYNGAIAVGPDTTVLETIFERARKKRKKTGLVAVCSITHATPASFVSHVPSRSMHMEIAEQMASARTDLYLGGGWGWFLPTDRGGRRTDGKNLIEAMRRDGYTYVSTDSEFQALDIKQTKKLIGLFEENHVGPVQERKPSLRAMTATAIDLLSRSRRGFFLMVEGSQIDWASHDNDATQTAIEMADFDDAIEEVVRFAKRQGDTLVIVTADHETGGYAIVDGSAGDKTVDGRFATQHHTGTMVPLFAMGPGAERFSGIITVSDVGRVLVDLSH